MSSEENSKDKVFHTYEDVYEVFATYIVKQEDRDLIKKSYLKAKECHKGIFRKSGEPYIHHLIEVAYIVTKLQAGPNTIAAAFLHDIVEDTNTSVEDIKKEFNEEIANIVDAVTKIQRLKLSHRTSNEMDAEESEKIKAEEDISVVFVDFMYLFVVT